MAIIVTVFSSSKPNTSDAGKQSTLALDILATRSIISTNAGNTKYIRDFSDFLVMCPHHSNMSKVKTKHETEAYLLRDTFESKILNQVVKRRCCYLTGRENELIEHLM